MRIVFAWCDADFLREGPGVFPEGTEFKSGTCLPRGQTVYIALDEDHLQRYEALFPGVLVRVRSHLRHNPLEDGGAMYLPVMFDAWVAVCDGHSALGAGLEAAACLGAQTAVCPGFDITSLPGARASLALTYRRRQDRVFPDTQSLKNHSDHSDHSEHSGHLGKPR